MKIAIGSKNPLKLSSVRDILKKVKTDCEYIPIDVPSGVSHTPLSNEETLAGARRRAAGAMKIAAADWGVGLEGGMTKVGGEWFTCVWCVIQDGYRETVGGGVHFQLPDTVVRGILEEGNEMGAGMDELTGIIMSKRKMGAEGILTGGLIDRKTTFENAVIYALAPRLSPDYYTGPGDSR